MLSRRVRGLVRPFSLRASSRSYSADDGMIRLAKLMAQKGLCSRREAENYIQAGAVLVNGKKVEGDWMMVAKDSDVRLDRVAQHHQRHKATILLNKPLGYVSSQPEDNHTPAIKLLTTENEFYDEKRRQKPNPNQTAPINLPKMAVCGRLDVNSTGLLIFTQDGTLAKQILDPNGGIEKEYLVRVDVDLTKVSNRLQKQLDRLRDGITVDDIHYRAKEVEVLNANQLRFILTEGKNRHIRRMCEAVGIQVRALKRVRIGDIKLGKLPVGEWRYLNHKETI